MHQPLHKSLWRRTRSLAPVGAIAVAALLTGCEDDEKISVIGGAGTAGTSTAGTGNGGTAGANGGTAGAGNGGTAGAGNGGTAGAGNGGTAGAGNGGTAGAGNGGTAGAGNGGTAGAGNGGSAGTTLCGEATGDGTTTAATSVAIGGAIFTSPFDATPSPDGCSVYFTAIDPNSSQGAVFSVNRDGSALQRLDQGGVLVAPVGVAVSTDGKTLYIADTAYGSGNNDTGAVLSLSVVGGVPTVMTAGQAPRSISVVHEGSTDQVYFSGTNTTGAASLFKAAVGANTATEALTLGGEVGGIASNDGATLYLAAPDAYALVSSDGTTTTVVASKVTFGLPGGVALSTDGTAALVATRDTATGASGLLRVVLADKTTTFSAVGTGMTEPSGLHRANNVEVYAFVDALGTDGTGSVWIAAK